MSDVISKIIQDFTRGGTFVCGDNIKQLRKQSPEFNMDYAEIEKRVIANYVKQRRIPNSKETHVTKIRNENRQRK